MCQAFEVSIPGQQALSLQGQQALCNEDRSEVHFGLYKGTFQVARTRWCSLDQSGSKLPKAESLP